MAMRSGLETGFESRVEAEGKILVAAALGRELQPLKRERRSDLLLVETGEGTTNASREISRALDAAPRAVVGIGFAGALSSSLEVGDLVVATRIDGIADDFSGGLQARWLGLGLERLYLGAAITVDHVVCLSEGKRQLAGRLREGEIGIVDMESSA